MRVGDGRADHAFARTAAEQAAALEGLKRFLDLIAQFAAGSQKLVNADLKMGKGKIGGDDGAHADQPGDAEQKQRHAV